MTTGTEGAPLWVRSHDLCVWLLERLREKEGVLPDRLVSTAIDLAVRIGQALTFPASRRREQHEADRAIAELRELLRLVADTGDVSASQLRYALDELRTIGRMLGGWRRATRQRDRQRHETRGVEP